VFIQLGERISRFVELAQREQRDLREAAAAAKGT
jgi:hypothetical protein